MTLVKPKSDDQVQGEQTKKRTHRLPRPKHGKRWSLLIVALLLILAFAGKFLLSKGPSAAAITYTEEKVAPRTITNCFMEENIVIRNEKKEDWETVEKITRQAFYNLYVPGCVEHYLVHIMREHEDFIPELDFVLELDGQVIGNIIYTKAKLIDENGTEKEILTFGPVSIHPGYQRMGYGKMLMEHSFQSAIQSG